MRPLAIYDDSPINNETMSKMSKALSGWYFSKTGGLMLTSHNRDLYFALQDLLTDVITKERWEADRMADPRKVFKGVLEREGPNTLNLGKADELLEHLENLEIKDWPDSKAKVLAHDWHKGCVPELAALWTKLDSYERFAVLQQFCSVLRTGLTYDVESRLR